MATRICEHHKRRDACMICVTPGTKGSAFCIHQKRLWNCTICATPGTKGSAYCIHHKLRCRCTSCTTPGTKGSAFCIHHKRRGPRGHCTICAQNGVDESMQQPAPASSSPPRRRQDSCQDASSSSSSISEDLVAENSLDTDSLARRIEALRQEEEEEDLEVAEQACPWTEEAQRKVADKTGNASDQLRAFDKGQDSCQDASSSSSIHKDLVAENSLDADSLARRIEALCQKDEEDLEVAEQACPWTDEAQRKVADKTSNASDQLRAFDKGQDSCQAASSSSSSINKDLVAENSLDTDSHCNGRMESTGHDQRKRKADEELAREKEKAEEELAREQKHYFYIPFY